MQDLQDVAAELWQFIQKENAIMRQRDFARHGHLSATDQPHIRDSVVGGATRPRRDERSAVTSEPGDTVDAGDFDGFREGQIRQDRREVAGFPEAWASP